MKLFTALHTHTTASDGQYTPTQLVQMAKEKGLQVLAITDHDTIAGVNEAQRAGGRYAGPLGYSRWHILP